MESLFEELMDWLEDLLISGIMTNVLDCFIHHDNEYMEERRKHVEDKLGEVSYEVLMYAMKEIFGAPTNEFKFYWIDEMENPRGYANTEEECKEQASIQCCKKYTVLPVR